MEAFVRSRVVFPLLVLALVAVFVASPSQQSGTMNTFVIIFRQGPRTLTDAEKQQRAQETGAWARRVNEKGHKLDPRILATEAAFREPAGAATTAGDGSPVTALLFLEAKDLDEAATIAEAHPGLRYGARVEVRPWAPPPQLR